MSRLLDDVNYQFLPWVWVESEKLCLSDNLLDLAFLCDITEESRVLLQQTDSTHDGDSAKDMSLVATCLSRQLAQKLHSSIIVQIFIFYCCKKKLYFFVFKSDLMPHKTCPFNCQTVLWFEIWREKLFDFF